MFCKNDEKHKNDDNNNAIYVDAMRKKVKQNKITNKIKVHKR